MSSITHQRTAGYLAAMLGALRGMSPMGDPSRYSTRGAFGREKSGPRADNPAGTKLAKRFAKGRSAAPRGY